jgi:hypothetical protein
MGLTPADIRESQFKDLLQWATELKQAAEGRADEARQIVIDLAKKLVPEELEKRPGWIEQAPLAEIKAVVSDKMLDKLDEGWWYKQHYDQHPATDGQPKVEPSAQDSHWVAVIKSAQQEIDQLQVANRQYESQVQQQATALRQQQARAEQLQTQVAQLSEQLAAARFLKSVPAASEASETRPSGLIETAAVDVSLWPDWLKKWSEESGFETDRRFIIRTGQVWECRRSRLGELTTEADGPSLNAFEVTTRLSKHAPALLEIIKCDQSIGLSGRNPDLINLTAAGCDAYRLLTGGQPTQAYTEYLKRHKSVPQVILVLAAIDLLQSAGYHVERFPPDIHLAGDRLSAPDLVATCEGQAIAIEAEVGLSHRNAEDRQRKWSNVLEAQHGEIHVITPSNAAMLDIRSEILGWVSQKKIKQYQLRMTNVNEALQKAELTSTSLWLSERSP